MTECTCCKEQKDVDEFYKGRKGKGIRQPCKCCIKLKGKIKRAEYTEGLKVLPDEKECGTCGETKPKESFAKRADTPTGLRSDCKDCISVKRQQHYEDNKEHVLERTNQYRLDHLEDYSKWKRIRYWKDPELSRAKSRGYREKNIEHCREYSRLWRKNNPDKVKFYDDRYLSNPENRKKRKLRRKKWRDKNKDLICHYSSDRRARVLKATPVWSDKEVIKSFYKEAQYFGESVDHIIPLKSHLVCGLHVESNLQLMPLSENIKKNNSFEICEHELPEWFEEEL